MIDRRSIAPLEPLGILPERVPKDRLAMINPITLIALFIVSGVIQLNYGISSSKTDSCAFTILRAITGNPLHSIIQSSQIFRAAPLNRLTGSGTCRADLSTVSKQLLISPLAALIAVITVPALVIVMKPEQVSSKLIRLCPRSVSFV